jgi:hypothetical protein
MFLTPLNHLEYVISFTQIRLAFLVNINLGERFFLREEKRADWFSIGGLDKSERGRRGPLLTMNGVFYTYIF